MFIKIFGIVIATGKDKETFLSPPVAPCPVTEQKEKVSPVALLAAPVQTTTIAQRVLPEDNKTRELFLKTIDPFNDLHPITRAISWPDPGEDSFKRSVAHKEIIEFDRMAKNGWFDICPIRDLVRTLNITMTNSGGVAYRKLHDLHCAHWENIEEDFIKILPALVSEVFAGVEFPKEGEWIQNNYKF